MPLSPGTSIGPYEISAPLGAGGMGEVYRARDARLGREVAIKSLPTGFASDPDRVVRLEREARLLASLNHPNVAALYGIERVDGMPFLALELVAGESLAERLARGPLPVDEALDIAAQVASALEAAHEAGMVHRDLKPGNIMVRPDGVAKVLDFGLARGPATGPAAADLSQSPTLVSPATIPGMILGTAAYMSPEQARGRATDRRADIWAWGCVVYECLTSQRAFPGEDVSETLASILKSEPDWSALPASTPPGVRALVERCLRKDPRERLRDAGDLRLMLAEARASTPIAPAKRDRSQSFAFQIGITILASVAGVLATRLMDRDKAEPATLTFAAPSGVSFDRNPTSIVISPDGRQMVFVAIDTLGAPRLWVRSLGRENGRPLNGTENAMLPFFSPDGRRVGFFADSRVKIVDLGTGAVQSLADAPLPRGGAWARGRILYQPRSLGPLWSIPEEGGTAAVATAVDSAAGDYGHRFPQFLPDGRHFIATVLARDGTWAAVGEIGKPKMKRLFATAGSTGATWANGWLIALREGAVKAQRFSRSFELKGPAVVLPGLRFVSPDAAGSPVVSASSNGTLVQRFSGDLPQRLAMVDRGGRTIRDIPAPVGTFFRGAMSPDRRFAMFEYSTPGSDAIHLWRADLIRGTFQPMTFEGVNFAPAISPDGREIAFTRELEGKNQNLWVMRSDDPGSQRLLIEFPGVFNTVLGYAPNGGVLLRTQGTETRQDLIFVSRTDSARVQTVLASRFNEPTGSISPDGRWLAYVSDESGSYECRVRPFPIGAGQVTVVSQGGAWGDPTIISRIGIPKWRRDGRELIYASADGRTLMSVSVTPGPVPQFGPPRPLFRLANAVTDIVPSTDMDEFILSITREEEGRSTATILLNWTRLVAKK